MFYPNGITGSVTQNLLDMSRTELDGDLFVLFSWFGLRFMGCMRFVNVYLCVCVRKKSEVLLSGCLCVEVTKPLRASCSSQIIMLLKGLSCSLPGAERQHFPYLHFNICSTSFDASAYCSDLTIINDFSNTLIESSC